MVDGEAVLWVNGGLVGVEATSCYAVVVGWSRGGG